MATSRMAQSGPVTVVLGIAQYNMVDMAYRQTGFNRRDAAETYKALRRLASGVTGTLEMEEPVVIVLTTGLG